MKVHLINYDTKSGFHSGPRGFKVGLQEESIVSQGNSVGYNGSRAKSSDAAVYFTGNNAKIEKLGKTFFDKVAQSKATEKILGFFDEKPVVAQSLIALVVAGLIRPATNMAMASKQDREDSMYAASHAISSAVIGYLASSILMAPFNDAAKKINAKPENYLRGAEKNLGVIEIGSRKLGKSRAYQNLSQFAKMLPDSIVFGILKAMLTIALIPPILKYVFHVEKKPKQNVSNQQVNVEKNKVETNKIDKKINTDPNTVFSANKSIDFCTKPVFKNFKGGVR